MNNMVKGPLSRQMPTAEQDRLARAEEAIAILSGYYNDLLARITTLETRNAIWRDNAEKLTHRIVLLEAELMPQAPSAYMSMVMIRKRLEALKLPEANKLMLTMMDEATRRGDREAMLALNEPVPGLSDNRMVDYLILQRYKEEFPEGAPGYRDFWERPGIVALVDRVAKAEAEMQHRLETVAEEVRARYRPTAVLPDSGAGGLLTQGEGQADG